MRLPLLAAFGCLSAIARAQIAPPPPAQNEIVSLPTFEVSTDQDCGYQATKPGSYVTSSPTKKMTHVVIGDG